MWYNLEELCIPIVWFEYPRIYNCVTSMVCASLGLGKAEMYAWIVLWRFFSIGINSET